MRQFRLITHRFQVIPDQPAQFPFVINDQHAGPARWFILGLCRHGSIPRGPQCPRGIARIPLFSKKAPFFTLPLQFSRLWQTLSLHASCLLTMKSLISTAATGAAGGTGTTKEINMNTRQLLAIALTLSLPAASLLAQNDGPPPQNPSSPSAPGRPGPRRGFRPPPPLIAVLDANHDGVISADEIANASKSLLTLDKNGDGQLTQDELRPHWPPPPRAEGDGQQDGPPPQGGERDGPPKVPPPGRPPGLDP